MEYKIKLPTSQAILLSNSLQSEIGIIREMHTGGSTKLDEMFSALNETGNLNDFVQAVSNNGHEFTGKLQDTKFLDADAINNSKALHSVFAGMLAKSSKDEELSSIQAAFTAVNDIEKNDGIAFDGFSRNKQEENILSGNNSVTKALYETITKDPEFLRVKTDKFLSDSERQDKIAMITVGYLNPEPLNYSISEMAERMKAIQEVQKNPTDLDELMENVSRLRENIAFMSKLNEDGSTEKLFGNIDAAHSAVVELANNSVEETRGIDRAFAYDYDKKMTEALINNPSEVTVGQDSQRSNENVKEGPRL